MSNIDTWLDEVRNIIDATNGGGVRREVTTSETSRRLRVDVRYEGSRTDRHTSYAFVDKATGNVYKPNGQGWPSHVVGNVAYDARAYCGPYGVG